MKKSFIALGFCILLICTCYRSCADAGCGCDLPSQITPDSSNDPWVSAADLALLQQQAIQEHWTFSVGKNPAIERPLSELCGLVVPENWWVEASFDPCVPINPLPPHFDWREEGGCTPIKNQGGCGSCWAFGTMAALECNILIRDHKEVDLSEQWLVSCNRDGWGCDGGWWAHDYFQWKMDQCNGTGAVLENDFPYKAVDLPCEGPYQRPYFIDSWHYIGLVPGVTQTDAIKQAIMIYGPVSVGCAVTSAFGAYTGGVFNEDDPNAQINHAVALVGWDDSLGTKGAWILRNSWGPGWGEEGYMRIEYGVCKVGYGACYVKYPPKTRVDVTNGVFGVTVGIRNMGSTATTNIKYTISLKGGIFETINESYVDMIESLAPGEAIHERIPRLGFGPLSITVSVIPKNAGKLTKHVEGFLWGFLFVVVRN